MNLLIDFLWIKKYCLANAINRYDLFLNIVNIITQLIESFLLGINGDKNCLIKCYQL